MSAELVVIERDIFVNASPETVFAFLTDPVLMADWIGTSHQLDATPGGLLRIQFSQGDVARGHYTEVLPHWRVAFTWGWERTPAGQNPALAILPPGASLVEIDLEPKQDGTVLHFRHSHVPKDLAEQHLERWSHYLMRLQTAAAELEFHRR